MALSPYIQPYLTIRAFTFVILFFGIKSEAYSQHDKLSDSYTSNYKLFHKQKLYTFSKSIYFNSKQTKAASDDIITNVMTQVKSATSNHLDYFNAIQTDSILKNLRSKYSFGTVLSAKPFLKFNGGYISYNLNYRSNIDTPIVENNILQHSSNASLNFAIANIPLKVNYLLRRSNSAYFRDINDFQVEFDAGMYRNTLQSNLRQKLFSQIPKLRDSLLELNYKSRLKSVESLHELLTKPDQLQKVIEYKEILQLPDELNAGSKDTAENKRIADLKKEAKIFITEYNKNQKKLEILKAKKDSSEKAYNKMLDKIEKYKDFVLNRLNKNKSKAELEKTLNEFGLKEVKIPAKYIQLMNLRKFGLGRNQLNYSELTSKNISMSGLNVEYNSWYYIALSAGTVNYRFRDFVVNKLNRSPQYIYMARLGVGKIENNYFIISAYKGQKQLFASGVSGGGLQSINIQGFSAEAKLKLRLGTYIIAEVAESLSPDFRKNPVITQKFDLKDGSNKAVSLKFYSYLPKTNSRIEAMYKYTGANFQSFSSFQTNSTVKAWNIKAEQQFFKRKLRISAALKENDFSNPYILQNYKSNTIFKSIQGSFRAKNLPMVTIGYMPMSQLTYMDSTLTENHFQSLNVSLNHFYKIGERKATSSLAYNRFYNTLADTSFSYYNAESIFFSQQIEFLLYNMNLSVSHSKSPGFELNVLDAYISIKAGKFGSVGFGVKVNDFDKLINSVGSYGTLIVNVGKFGMINATYDNGFLPGNHHRFIKNNQMNINYIKQLK